MVVGGAIKNVLKGTTPRTSTTKLKIKSFMCLYRKILSKISNKAKKQGKREEKKPPED